MLDTKARAVLDALLLAFGTAEADPAVLDTQARCMAENIWFEARGSSFADKLAVAQVVLNRVADPDHAADPCAVIHEPWQFSWTNDGRPDKVAIENDIDRQAWVDSVLASLTALRADLPDLTQGATHYHGNGVSPAWAEEMQEMVRFGSHAYYARARDEVGAPLPKPTGAVMVAAGSAGGMQGAEELAKFWSHLSISGLSDSPPLPVPRPEMHRMASLGSPGNIPHQSRGL